MGEQLERYRWLIAGLFAVPLLSAVFYLVSERLENGEVEIRQAEAPADIRVHVAGAVRNPGVYPLPPEARWSDAIEAAGGFAPDADPTGVNLARRAHDEDQIIVPSLNGGAAVAGASREPLVNINTASEEELIELPGIGEVRARAIIASREAEGPFTRTEELLDRGVVPRSVYEEIEPLITVGP